MRAVNLFLLTREKSHESMSCLFQALSGSKNRKIISPHEAASLCMLTELLAGCMQEPSFPFDDWVPFF